MSIQEEKLQAIADAIRAKEKSSDKITADDYAERILDLPEPEMVFEWTITNPPVSNQMVLGYGGGKFVTLGLGLNGAYSSDGITWTSVTRPGSSISVGSVVYDGSKFVAVSSNYNYCYYSQDGTSWTLSDTYLPAAFVSPLIAYGDGKFVIINRSNNSIAYSSNAINWEAGSLPIEAGVGSIAYGNGKFVALSAGTTFYRPDESDYALYSEDGITWVKTNLSSAPWSAVTFGGGKFVAISSLSNVAAYSEDGITWVQTTLPDSSNSYCCLAYGEGKFVALAYSNTYNFLYSFDGIKWEIGKKPLSVQFLSLVYGNGKFVAITTSKFGYASYHALDTSDADATSSDILSPKTAYVKGEKVTGTITTKEAADVTVSANTVTTPAGYYPTAVSKSVTTVTHNAPTQESVLGTYATIRATHTQAEGYITGADTKTADYNITRNAGGTKTPGTANQTLLNSGYVYLNSPLVMSGSSNLLSSNIREGVNIFGIVGSYSNKIATSTITLNFLRGYPWLRIYWLRNPITFYSDGVFNSVYDGGDFSNVTGVRTINVPCGPQFSMFFILSDDHKPNLTLSSELSLIQGTLWQVTGNSYVAYIGFYGNYATGTITIS